MRIFRTKAAVMEQQLVCVSLNVMYNWDKYDWL